jgi:hypothetical protein
MNKNQPIGKRNLKKNKEKNLEKMNIGRIE